MTSNVVKKAKAGFIISLIGGILITVNALFFFGLTGFYESLEIVLPFILGGVFTLLGGLGAVFGILVIIGAILMYIPGKATYGGILAIFFSIFSIIIGGGFIIGLILGILGGILGLAKK